MFHQVFSAADDASVSYYLFLKYWLNRLETHIRDTCPTSFLLSCSATVSRLLWVWCGDWKAFKNNLLGLWRKRKETAATAGDLNINSPSEERVHCTEKWYYHGIFSTCFVGRTSSRRHSRRRISQRKCIGNERERELDLNHFAFSNLGDKLDCICWGNVGCQLPGLQMHCNAIGV